MKIAIFCPNWIGDAVMATPAMRAVRKQFPRAEITAILRPYVADVLAGTNLVDRIIPHDPVSGRGRKRMPETLWGLRLVRALRQERFDSAILFPNSFRSAWWAWISGAKQRVGFNREGRGWLLTDSVSFKSRSEPHPVIDEYLRLAAHIGCRHLTRNMELAVLPEDERQFQTFWRRHVSAQGQLRRFVCLNPGGAFGSAKHWPTSSFAELARRIVRQLDKYVLVLAGPAERDEARAIVALANHPGIVTVADDHPTIGLTKAAIKHADLLITTDSGPRHFAPPFGVPVVTLFGPTHVAWSETYYDRSLHLQLEVDCGPCQQRVCPLKHHRCMKDLSPEWAFKAAVSMLEKYPAERRAA